MNFKRHDLKCIYLLVFDCIDIGWKWPRCERIVIIHADDHRRVNISFAANMKAYWIKNLTIEKMAF